MKRLIMITSLCGMLLMCSCEDNTVGNIEFSETSETSSAITETIPDNSEATEIHTQSVTEKVSDTETETITITTISSLSTTTEALQTETTTLQTTQTSSQTMETFTEPADKSFEIDENGAVIMEVQDETDDSELISAGQILYEKACETDFRYHVGCPYNLDYNTYIENQYGWPYYLVTNEGYTSIADVEKDYYKIFAEERGNDLSEIYMEQDGRVYALDGARGANIFYESSEVTGIIEKTDNKIVFSVDNHYTGDDRDPEASVTETEQFSVIIHDGEWRVAEFYLPY